LLYGRLAPSAATRYTSQVCCAAVLAQQTDTRHQLYQKITMDTHHCDAVGDNFDDRIVTILGNNPPPSAGIPPEISP